MSREFFEYLKQEYFEDLYSGESSYGELYEEFLGSTHVSEKDAVEVARLLDKEKIEEAEDLVEEVLTDDEN